MKSKGGLVYSTDKGRICPGCLRPLAECVCRDQSRTRAGSAGQSKVDGAVFVSRETKGRKGAGVTLIRGLPLSEQDLKQLARRLKATCGVGGSVKDGTVELQGDQRDKVQSLLETEGHVVKRSGG